MSAPTVLTVLPDLPFPAMNGLQLRMAANLRVVRSLADRSFVLWFGQQSADAQLLQQACDEAIFAGSPVPYASFSVAARVGHRVTFASEALARRPGARYPFSLPYDEIGAERIVREVAGRLRPDFVLLPTFLSHYARGLVGDGRRVIGDAIDVLTDQTSEFLRIYGRSRPWRFPGLLANHMASWAQERLFLPLCDELWANSDAQAERLRQIAPDTRVVVVANVLDEDAIEVTPLPPSPTIGFIGSYFYLPNLDAARYLAQQVLPLLQSRIPEAKLLLAGSGMTPDDASSLKAIGGVSVLGRVPDSRVFMASCRALAFPLFFESGPPLKIVEALACGRPVVGSPQAADALGLCDGHDALVARSAGACAEALARVLGDADLAAALAAAGRGTFEKRFSLGATLAGMRRHSVLSGGQPVAG